MILIAMKGERFTIIPSPLGYAVWGKGVKGDLSLKNVPIDATLVDCLGQYPTFKGALYAIGSMVGEDFKGG